MRAKDELKEQQIREQAIQMIVHSGFDGLSMQKLARAAGISASTIYIYFDNREHLLNQLYVQVNAAFMAASMEGFNPAMDFEQGLWLQWENRYRHIRKDPVQFRFSEQFRTSPLIRKELIQDHSFKDAMDAFIRNAVSRRQLIPLPAAVFWALAYGPFYTLVKFHLDNSTMAGKDFTLNKSILRMAFDQVLRSLTPISGQQPAYDPNIESLL